MDNYILKPSELRIGNLIYDDLERVGKVGYLTASRIEVLPEGTKGWTTAIRPKGIPITEERLIKFGFEKKEVYGWKGNGQDWQPETQKTECLDFVLHIGEDNDFFIRYETMSYRESEQYEWVSYPASISVHYGDSWYDKANFSVGWPPCDYLHQLQNLVFALSGKELT